MPADDLAYVDTLWKAADALLGQADAAEDKLGGEFYTPRCVVRLLVEMLEPDDGRIYDPCCGSDSMLVPSERFDVIPR